MTSEELKILIIANLVSNPDNTVTEVFRKTVPVLEINQTVHELKKCFSKSKTFRIVEKNVISKGNIIKTINAHYFKNNANNEE